MVPKIVLFSFELALKFFKRMELLSKFSPAMFITDESIFLSDTIFNS